MEKNGFIASSLLYGMLALFLVIMLSTLAIFANSKISMDKLKAKAFDDVENEKISASLQTLFNLDVADKIVENDSTPGLHIDGNEPDRYIYKGGSDSSGTSMLANNYICLDTNVSGTCDDNDLYRIISVESDGTIKVIKYINDGLFVFDAGYTSNVGDWRELNTVSGTRYSSNVNDYCYSADQTAYAGCNSWGSKTSMTGSQINTSFLPASDAYMNIKLNGGTYGGNGMTETISPPSINNVIKNNIVTHTFNIGSISSNSSGTLEDNVEAEKQVTWTGFFGLMTATDYVKASLNPACTNVSSYLNNASCYESSSNDNWLLLTSNTWTLTADSNNKTHLYYIKIANNGKLDTLAAGKRAAAHPVFFLKSGLEFSGDGTKNVPYRIK